MKRTPIIILIIIALILVFLSFNLNSIKNTFSYFTIQTITEDEKIQISDCINDYFNKLNSEDISTEIKYESLYDSSMISKDNFIKVYDEYYKNNLVIEQNVEQISYDYKAGYYIYICKVTIPDNGELESDIMDFTTIDETRKILIRYNKDTGAYQIVYDDMLDKIN